jgi:glycosyltransferase involved in cell wall biosynthesis
MSIKVLHVSAFDLAGGAARATYRIHQSLQKNGVDSQLLVQYKSSDDHSVMMNEGKIFARFRSLLNGLPLHRYPDRTQLFSPQNAPDTIAAQVGRLNPDIVNLNWVCNGFLRIETLSHLKKPIVWTLQDMWAFTGGCHYSLGCDRYEAACGQCPQLQSQHMEDLSHQVWQRKAQAWQNIPLTVVAPSLWLANCARSSGLFRDRSIQVIPLGLDTSIFTPMDQRAARSRLNLPQDKQLVLFGAIDATGDTRKGFHLLQQALKRLSLKGWSDRIELVVFGASQPQPPIDLGFPIHYLGKFQDDLALSAVYSAADVMIAPSIEEAFGQTASESLACGTPVVVFKNTGLQDIVDHQCNGYLANHCDTDDLARGIAWVLEFADYSGLRDRARQKAEREYTLNVQASRYLSLFQSLLSSNHPAYSLR